LQKTYPNNWSLVPRSHRAPRPYEAVARSRAARFRKIIREQFVRMYKEHDVLADVLEEARRDIGGERLPTKHRGLAATYLPRLFRMRDASHAR
jgi:hypothetical protein